MSVRTIAKQLGVHFTTVSKALQDNPHLPPELIQRVKRAAVEAGYYVDPRVSNLMTHLSTRSKLSGRQTKLKIGLLLPSLEILHTNKNYLGHFQGIEIQAKKMGYQLELLPVTEPKVTFEALIKHLHFNQIKTLIVTGMENNPLELCNWDRFSIVTVGFRYRNFHSASANHYKSMLEILYRLHGFGYQRIGVSICAGDLPKTDYQYDAALKIFQAHLPSAQKIEPLFFRNYEFDSKALDAWIQETRPEIVIGDTLATGLWVKKKYPSIDFAHLYHNGFYKSFGGMDQGLREVGSAAVKLAVSNSISRIKGESDFPQRIVVDSKFFPGKSIRKGNHSMHSPQLEWLMGKHYAKPPSTSQ